jgi:large subunit ribosomal protein L2
MLNKNLSSFLVFQSLIKRINTNKLVQFSTTTANLKNEVISSTIQSEWKKDVVVVPVQTTIEDLKKTHRLLKDGMYISHRTYIDKLPDKYTIEPIPTKRTGGYDIETGTKLFRRVGGGLPIDWYFIDFKRVGPKSGPPLVEKVIDIFKTRDRTSFIALVAHANVKRLILATENMKIGDLIRTSGEIPRVAVKANDGDAFPVGALPNGTKINCIEPYPGAGAVYCKAAGSSAEITNRTEDRIIVKLPSNLEISLDKYCMV